MDLTRLGVLLAEAMEGDVPAEVDAAMRRLERWGPELLGGLQVYGDAAPALAERVVRLVGAARRERRHALRELDEQRLLRPDWHACSDQVGYVAYADRFAGDLRGVSERIGYLRELGTTYLHLMPLLDVPDGPDDGGYAVRDYRRIRPDLGTAEDLVHLADALHRNGMALTLDLVLNHVADQHAWAVAAKEGSARHRAMFLTFPDRTVPDAYERTLPEVFPDFAPGSFTWSGDLDAWVWTTFNRFQWDLDWSNPDVFAEMLDVVLFLTGLGVDVLRLDAIAFLWKRMGTDCQGQPEVHDLVQALRAAVHVAAPGVLFKAEAIVAPEQLPAYLGTGRHAGRVSDLAYHNSLMVQGWSAIASGDARLATRALAAVPPKPVTATWATYVRAHDDIGWAVSDADAASVGLSGWDHRAFLAAWSTGASPGSPARGALFQVDPASGSARTSGSCATLAGVAAAQAMPAGPERDAALDAALGRIFLLHAIAYGYGGIPLLYMGDELALLDDRSYLADPARADDNRWLHRPWMDWAAAGRRADPACVEGRVFAGLRHLAQVRASLPSLHAAVESEPVDLGLPGVLALRRRHPAGHLLQLYAVSGDWERVPAGALEAALGARPAWEHLSGFAPAPDTGPDGTAPLGYALPPYAAWWLSRG